MKISSFESPSTLCYDLGCNGCVHQVDRTTMICSDGCGELLCMSISYV
jgi:hypothetical protein